MKLKEAIICDVRKEGVWEELHTLLFKIPPLKKYGPVGNVPLESLEKLMRLFDEKYGVRMQYIMNVPQKTSKNTNLPYYSCSVKSKHTNEWIGSVNGLTIYECFVKMVLLSYGFIKSQEKK